MTAPAIVPGHGGGLSGTRRTFSSTMIDLYSPKVHGGTCLLRTVVVALLLVLLPSHAWGEVCIAPLIGNEAYGSEIGRLANSHNDVALLEHALKGLGFEVSIARDAGLGALTRAVNACARHVQAAGPGAIGFFYSSGHRASDGSANYLIPVDMKTTETRELWDELLGMSILAILIGIPCQFFAITMPPPYSIAFGYSVISAVTGMFLPDLIWIGPFRHPINLIWGSIYGVGWFVAGLLFMGVRSHEIGLFGFLIWPLIVIVLVTALLGRALQYHPHRRKMIIAVAVISLLFLIPRHVLMPAKPVLGYLPLWSEIFFEVY